MDATRHRGTTQTEGKDMLTPKKNIMQACEDWINSLTEVDKYDLDNNAREEFEVCIDELRY